MTRLQVSSYMPLEISLYQVPECNGTEHLPPKEFCPDETIHCPNKNRNAHSDLLCKWQWNRCFARLYLSRTNPKKVRCSFHKSTRLLWDINHMQNHEAT